MNKFTKEKIEEYADKLLIGLTSEENEMILSEFDIIDKNMELITKIPNIDEVTPMTHALDDFEFELREDRVTDSMDLDKLLKNCDSYEDREISVPKVVG